jgi:lambda family phage tail tape measure protein
VSQISVGEIVVKLGAETQKFSLDLDRANAKLAQTGQSFEGSLKKMSNSANNWHQSVKHSAHGVITEVQGVSAGLRTLEGAQNFRAGERFLATTLQLGPAFQKLFPIFGALALGDIVTNWIDKIQEFRQALKDTENAPLQIARDFQAINDPLKQTNDQLALANDKLRNEIATLQGKPTNNLALMLDEARVAADNLSAALNKDLQGVAKLLETNGTKWWQNLFFGVANNDDIKKQFEGENGFGGFRKQIDDIRYNANVALSNINPKSKTANADSGKIRQKERNDLEKAYGDQLGWVNTQLQRREGLQAKRNSMDAVSAKYGPDITGQRALVAGGRPDDQLKAIAELQQLRDNLLSTKNSIGLQFDNTDLTLQKDALPGKKKAAPTRDSFADRIGSLQAQLTAAKATLNAPSGDTVAAALAKGYGQAVQEIQSLNEGQKKLTLGQQAQIITLHDQIALTQFRTTNTKAWQTTLQQISDETKEMQQRDAEAAAQAEERQKRMAAEKLASIANTIANLNLETQANQRLTAAANLGQDAQRRAQIENIKNSGQDPGIIKARIAVLQSQNKLSDAQTLSTGSAKDGATRYFSEMKDNVESTAKSVHDVLGGAFNGLNQTLAGLVAGQKTSWSSFFSGLAAQIAEISLKNLEGNLLGSIFGGGGSKGGGWGGILTSLFGGGKASGGSIDPSKYYMVGENGPELFAPGVSGSIIPNNKLGSNAAAFYYIDARGTDPVQVQRNVNRSLVQVHGSAVQNAIAVQKEMQRRSPRSKVR